jgi:hypothetical protein
MERPMSEAFDASRSLTALEQDSTIIAVIEMSQAKWLVAGVVPGVERQPLKRLTADEAALLKLLHRWRNEAGQAGRQIKRIVVAYEAGRDGFFESHKTGGVAARPRQTVYEACADRIAGDWEHNRHSAGRLQQRPHGRAASRRCAAHAPARALRATTQPPPPGERDERAPPHLVDPP